MKLTGQQDEILYSMEELLKNVIPGVEVKEVRTLPTGEVEVEISIPIPENFYKVTIRLDDPMPAPGDNMEYNHDRR